MTLLATGKVLVTGGRSTTGTTGLATAELYDKTTGTWTATASMSAGRFLHRATQLNTGSNATTSGKVLISGGINGTTSLSTFQLYDPSGGNLGNGREPERRAPRPRGDAAGGRQGAGRGRPQRHDDAGDGGHLQPGVGLGQLGGDDRPAAADRPEEPHGGAAADAEPAAEQQGAAGGRQLGRRPRWRRSTCSTRRSRRSRRCRRCRPRARGTR